jgi:fucose 4-O-acetylase-like acetyltransferase
VSLSRRERVPEARTERVGALERIRDLAAQTPEDRDRYVDLLRAAAILVVVVGHWTVTSVTVTDGGLGWVNLLRVESWTHPVTWLVQVMPVVFLVGGYANAASWASHRARGGSAAAWVRGRALRLLRPAAAFLAALFAGYVVARVLGVDPSLARTAVWAAAISLWFLVVYLVVVALAPAVVAWQRRRGVVVLLTLVAVVAVGDVARLVTGAPAPAAANYVVAWLAIHQVGVAWREGSLTRSRWTAYVFALGGAVALVALTVWGPYAVTMVGAAPSEPANTAPPTLALLALAATQIGVALLLRPVVGPLLERPRVWWAVAAVNSVVLTIYLWHMVPVVIAGVALVGTGLFPNPAAGSGEWFALRVPWLLILAVVLAAVVAVVGRFEARGPRRARPGPSPSPSPVAVGLGVGACVAGLAGLGVSGGAGLLPSVRDVPVIELVLFGAGLATVSRTGRSR